MQGPATRAARTAHPQPFETWFQRVLERLTNSISAATSSRASSTNNIDAVINVARDTHGALLSLLLLLPGFPRLTSEVPQRPSVQSDLLLAREWLRRRSSRLLYLGMPGSRINVPWSVPMINAADSRHETHATTCPGNVTCVTHCLRVVAASSL